jgi:hypothetical protein
MRLESRDRQVLAETFLSRVVRRDDLIGLGFFGSVPRCNARLLALKEEGYLRSKSHLGGAELRAPLYICSATGVRVAAAELDIAPDEAIEAHRAGVRDLAIRHALKCTDLRLQFKRDLIECESLCLAEWSQEFLCHHEFTTSGDRTVVIKPDALAVLESEGRAHHLFIEADLGNAALPKYREKINRYCQYEATGAFADAYGAEAFSVLTVTTDERRLTNLLRVAEDLPFLFTTWKRVAAAHLVGPVVTSSRGDQQTLTEALR